MKKHAALPLVLLALFASASGITTTTHDLTDAQRARVEKDVTAFLGSYLGVMEGGDAEAIRGLYVDDERFAWFTDGEKRYASGDDIVAGLAAMKGMKFSTEASDVEVIALTPDLAHARSAFATKISQNGAVVYEFSGVITWLLEKEPDRWRVLNGHTSTPKERPR